MKKFVSALILLFTVTVSANAMSYEQAREQALFLTDKMAYELNLSEAQYEAAYEINLDYLMSIRTQDDLFGIYWRQRNLDLSYVLFDWQYSTFCDALYFYRPLYWNAGYWRFRIYARYPHRDYFYFGCPHFVTVYCGGHSWRHNGGRSWYRANHFRPEPDRRHFGMRDGFRRGDYGEGHRGVFGNRNGSRTPIVTSRPGNGGGSFGRRQATVTDKKGITTVKASSFGGMRGGSVSKPPQKPRDTFAPKNGGSSDNRTVRSNPVFSGSGRFGGSATNNRDLINNMRDRSSGSVNRSTGSFGSKRSTSTPSISRGSSRSSFSGNRGSFGTNRSSSGASRSSSSSSRGGSKFGGRR